MEASMGLYLCDTGPEECMNVFSVATQGTGRYSCVLLSSHPVRKNLTEEMVMGMTQAPRRRAP